MKIIKFYFVNLIFAFCILNLTGCATYKFHHGKAPLDKGYVVSRDDYAIPEYTLGENNTAPGIKLAKERFKRRRNVVEDYYKQMGLIQNHFKMAVIDPAVMFLKLVGGVFRLPFIAVSDYRYEHNPKYKERIDKMERDKEAQEEARVNKLKQDLHKYVMHDLSAENPNLKQAEVEPQEKPAQSPPNEPVREVAPEPVPETAQEAPIVAQPQAEEIVEPQPPIVVESEIEQIDEPQLEPPIPQKEAAQEVLPAPAQPQIVEEARKEAPEGLSADVRAAITANPQKGYSPLRVKFNASNSRSKFGRIVSYSWNFGDGDTSTKINPVNTYYSASFEPRYFTVTLTVKDIKGNTASTSTSIEVLNK